MRLTNKVIKSKLGTGREVSEQKKIWRMLRSNLHGKSGFSDSPIAHNDDLPGVHVRVNNSHVHRWRLPDTTEVDHLFNFVWSRFDTSSSCLPALPSRSLGHKTNEHLVDHKTQLSSYLCSGQDHSAIQLPHAYRDVHRDGDGRERRVLRE